MNNNKCVIYCRVSSREQEETGYSLDSQEKLLKEYAKKREFQVAKTFVIAESASGSKQRKVFGEMMAFLNQNKVTNLLCEKVDRLTRNLKEAVVANDWVEDNSERKIHFVKQNLVICKDSKSDDKFRWDIEIVIAKKFIANLSEEVKKGQKEKIAQGWLPTKPPLGYKTIGDKGHKIHIIDDNKGPYLKKAFEYYATGNYSIMALLAKLHEEGLRNTSGGKVSKSRLADILRDPFYVGSMKWNDIIYNGQHKPLVSRELFDKVQYMLTRGDAPHYKRHTFVFTKMIKCGECNGTISGEIQKGNIYYSCKHKKICSQRGMVKEKEIENSLLNTFRIFENITSEEADQIRDKIRRDHQLEIDYKEGTLKSLNLRYGSLQRQLDILYDDRLSERISPERWAIKQGEINKEQMEIQSQISKIKDEETRYFEIYINILDLARRAREIYDKRTPEEKRLLLSYIFSNLYLKDKKASNCLKKSVEVIAKRVQEKIDSKNKFELQKTVADKRKNRALHPVSSSLLREQDSNLRPIA